jgi:hypothetical protein
MYGSAAEIKTDDSEILNRRFALRLLLSSTDFLPPGLQQACITAVV